MHPEHIVHVLPTDEMGRHVEIGLDCYCLPTYTRVGCGRPISRHEAGVLVDLERGVVVAHNLLANTLLS